MSTLDRKPDQSEATRKLDMFEALIGERFEDAQYILVIKNHDGNYQWRTKCTARDMLVAGNMLVDEGIKTLDQLPSIEECCTDFSEESEETFDDGEEFTWES